MSDNQPPPVLKSKNGYHPVRTKDVLTVLAFLGLVAYLIFFVRR
jgi:hypothetical protein